MQENVSRQQPKVLVSTCIKARDTDLLVEKIFAGILAMKT